MSLSNEAEFDFEAWAKLAESDPSAFEAQRRAHIERVIAEAPPERQARLRGLQWRIDMERKKHRHALASCTHLFNKMWSAVYDEGGLSDALNGRLPQATRSATVLRFAPDRRERLRGVMARPS